MLKLEAGPMKAGSEGMISQDSFSRGLSWKVFLGSAYKSFNARVHMPCHLKGLS